jgi:hypothetical protein
MKNHEIDAEDISFYIHEAQRMRAEVLNELLLTWGANVKQGFSSLGKYAVSLTRRGRLNLSLPAPHH